MQHRKYFHNRYEDLHFILETTFGMKIYLHEHFVCRILTAMWSIRSLLSIFKTNPYHYCKYHANKQRKKTFSTTLCNLCLWCLLVIRPTTIASLAAKTPHGTGVFCEFTHSTKAACKKCHLAGRVRRGTLYPIRQRLKARSLFSVRAWCEQHARLAHFMAGSGATFPQ